MNGQDMVAEPLVTFAPSPALRPYISHYWLSRDNRDPAYSVIPDGAVDLVVAVDGINTPSFIYGTATRCYREPLIPGAHYLGVRFWPGRARHFLTVAVHELTDVREPSRELLSFGLEDLPETILGPGAIGPEVVDKLDRLLMARLSGVQPDYGAVDRAVALIAASQGTVTIEQLAMDLGISRRQLERTFRLTVGVPAKLFSRICRFHYALSLMTGQAASLADVAAQANYSDQSHMTHEFRQFTGRPPSDHLRVP